MSRRSAIESVLDFAAAHPSAGLGYEWLPEVRSVFASRRSLLLALEEEWTLALWQHVEWLSMMSCLADPVAVGEQAWRECAAQRPVLRRVLDEHQRELSLFVRRPRVEWVLTPVPVP